MKRSQIFLLLTLLMITFLVSISTTLLDVRRGSFTDPNPQLDAFENSWDITISNINFIVERAVAQRSDGNFTTAAEMQTFIDAELVNLENFILQSSFSANIQLVTAIADGVSYVPTTDGSTFETFDIVDLEFFINISNANIQFTQRYFLDMTISAQVDATNNFIDVFRIVNGQRDGVTDATFATVSTITELYGGRYQYSGALGATDIRIPSGILLNVVTA